MRPEAKPYEVWDLEVRGLLVRVQPSGVRSYYCAYRASDGRRNRVRIGDALVVSSSDARDEARKILADVIRGADPALEKKRSKTETFGAFLERVYEPWVLSNRKTGALTVRRLKSCFGELMQTNLDDLSAWTIEKWRMGRRKAGVSAATVNRDLVALKSALSRAYQWDLIKTPPLAKVKLQKVDHVGRVRFLSEDEETRLRNALNQREARIKASRDSGNNWRRQRGYRERPSFGVDQTVDHLLTLVLLALNTGMRRGELFGLRWSDVSFERQTLTVTSDQAKSGVGRHIPLNQEARSVLSLWRAANPSREGLVFPGATGERLDNCRRAWTRVINAAGVNAFRFHDLRHTFASRLVMRGVDLNTVRELLGHADIKMTLRYAHLSSGIKTDAVARLDRGVPGDAASDLTVRAIRL